MKTTKYGKSKFTSRGFYITLAVCLLAVGVATAIAISQTVKVPQNTTLESSSESSIDENTQAADTEQSNVAKEESSASQETQEDTATAKNKAATEFAMPLEGEIINEFSNGNLVKNETMGDWRTHDGIDIAAQEGTPVKSCADGKVTEISENPMWGICITIDHGNYVSYYFGLNKTVQVKMDQQVKLGDVIGSVGSTNQLELSEDPHLHFGMKKDNQWIDPLSVIRQ